MIERTELEGVLEIQIPFLQEDFRGSNSEIYNHGLYQNAVLDNVVWKIDSVTTSRKHVLRGLHGDANTYKLITCLHGSIYLIVVDARPWSPQYRQWISFTLTDKNKKQILVPPGFGNGHLVMSDVSVFHYKWSEYYDRNSQFTIKWNDPNFEFWWPIKHPILSERDS